MENYNFSQNGILFANKKPSFYFDPKKLKLFKSDDCQHFYLIKCDKIDSLLDDYLHFRLNIFDYEIKLNFIYFLNFLFLPFFFNFILFFPKEFRTKNL